MDLYAILILGVILFPISVGTMLLIVPIKNRSHRMFYVEGATVLNSLVVFYILFNSTNEVVEAVQFTGNLSIAFRIDGLGSLFAGLIALLWPFATLYSIEYMRKEEYEKIFFSFYLITYGVTLGVAMAANLITMYFYYELLTLSTVPLILQKLNRGAILASRKYLYYSLGGAAFAFIGVLFFIIYGQTANFTYGGVLERFAYDDGIINSLYFVYVITFMGFGVKAAIFPLNAWLPEAGVAATPVTALLHAVAVVKAGVFAIMRVTYYSFGANFLRGTWAQQFVMFMSIITILYGCSMAIKETHLKRRLAYSTISNLSYILFGISIMTAQGFTGAMLHMVAHAFSKIIAFLCVGSIMHQSGKNYIHEVNGLGKRMPIVCSIFTLASFSLMGIPLLPIFVSKWNIAMAAVLSKNTLAYWGIGALLTSALLTAIYLLTIVLRFFFQSEEDTMISEDVKDPNWHMLIPLVIFTLLIIVCSANMQGTIEYLTQVALGIK
ncbi:MAG: proton-conducting transporter membrane subunit [Eubacteriales bacterium]